MLAHDCSSIIAAFFANEISFIRRDEKCVRGSRIIMSVAAPLDCFSPSSSDVRCNVNDSTVMFPVHVNQGCQFLVRMTATMSVL